MEKQSIVFIVIALIVGFALGLLLVLSLNPSLLTNKDVEIKKQLINELRERGYLLPEPEIITDVYGKVKNVSTDTINLVLEDRYADPLNEFLPTIMAVKINEGTEIFKLVEKSWDVYEQEQEDFNRKMEQYQEGETPTDLIYPEPFTKIDIEISEINEGDIVSALSDSDFKGQSEFTAISIQVEQVEELPEE